MENGSGDVCRRFSGSVDPDAGARANDQIVAVSCQERRLQRVCRGAADVGGDAIDHESPPPLDALHAMNLRFGAMILTTFLKPCAAQAAGAGRPEFKRMRQDEDWSALRDISLR